MPTSDPEAAPAFATRPENLETDAGPPEFPVREYIGAMAMELAQMARFDGDEPLAVILDAAADRAALATGRRRPEAQPRSAMSRPS